MRRPPPTTPVRRGTVACSKWGQAVQLSIESQTPRWEDWSRYVITRNCGEQPAQVAFISTPAQVFLSKIPHAILWYGNGSPSFCRGVIGADRTLSFFRHVCAIQQRHSHQREPAGL